jgi:hypothetical protein
MNRKEKIELLKQVAAGKISLTKYRCRVWSQDFNDFTLFHCLDEKIYSTDILPANGFPAAATGEIFSNAMFYHSEAIQFKDGSHTPQVTDQNPYTVFGNITLYFHPERNQVFDAGFIF